MSVGGGVRPGRGVPTVPSTAPGVADGLGDGGQLMLLDGNASIVTATTAAAATSTL